MELKRLANAVICTLAEVDEAPEGILYAGIMTAGATLDDFYTIKSFLLRNGLVTAETGPTLKATDKLRRIYAAATTK